MTGHDIDRTLADWFHTEARASEPADGLERVLVGVRRRRPMPGWRAGHGSHWGWAAPIDRPTLGIRALVVVAILAALLGGALLVGTRLLVAPAPLPPRLGQLAYSLDGDIFVADWDGTNPVRVADGVPGGKSGCGSAGFWAEGSMWSPDGRYLVYRSERSQVECDRPLADTFPTIVLSDPKGAVIAQVPGVGWLIPWSPDSTRFATWLDQYPGTRIGVYGVDGVRQAELSLPLSLAQDTPGDYDPVVVGSGPVHPGHGRLARCDRDLLGGSPCRRRCPYGWSTETTHGRTGCMRHPPTGPRSPTSRVEMPWSSHARMGPSPAKYSPVTVDSWDRPRWSPAGDEIAFVASQDDGDGNGTLVGDPTAIRLIDVASGSTSILVQRGPGISMGILAFSPEGDRILFSMYRHEAGGGSLWSVDTDGTGLRMLVDGTTAGDWQSVHDQVP